MNKSDKSTARCKSATLTDFSSLRLLQLIEHVVNIMEDSRLQPSAWNAARPYAEELARRFSITWEQAVWFSALVNMSDDCQINANDLGRFFECRPISVLAQWDQIEALTAKRYICINGQANSRASIMVPEEVVAALRHDTVYTPSSYANISVDKLLDRINDLLDRRDHTSCAYDAFVRDVKAVLDDNQQLPFVQHFQAYNLSMEHQLILLRTICNFVINNDEVISSMDIMDILEERFQTRENVRLIARGKHPLQMYNLIENQNEDGQVNTQVWHLTDAAKEEFLIGVEVAVKQQEDCPGMILADQITEKHLFYNPQVTKMVGRLHTLLDKEYFTKVQERLAQQNMRGGFACIFYGAPGTGKTETVYQLARETGRGIMMVDVPNLRSKWVGDTEKNIKAVFDRYRRYVDQMEVAPILLFNEADAVLCRRNESAITGVDKMENAMQNIILQEMENLNGIMIATTNLTGNMDSAFERRFLYKIEFPKPTPAESCHIWKAMLTDLNDEQAMLLAQSYDFSGGQIENIARKQIVDSILFGEETVNLNSIREACAAEQFKATTAKHIGFAS
ncbi:MAG: ATP-binding protein [Paludibacteraceae bacterium]|nr:ATP-binding protein [Paludibacteraceae bacterium]